MPFFKSSSSSRAAALRQTASTYSVSSAASSYFPEKLHPTEGSQPRATVPWYMAKSDSAKPSNEDEAKLSAAMAKNMHKNALRNCA